MTDGFRVRAFGALATAAAVVAALSAAGPAAAITGGADADLPFVARLAIGDTERACTGALVHPQVVLTAAACFADAQGAVRAGEPARRTTVTVGRPDLAGTGGTVTTVTDVLPHPERNLALVRLEAPAGVAPVAVATAAPQAGETLTVAGFGRTGSEWVPGRLKSGIAVVAAVSAGTVDVVPEDGGAGICKGDAGGPAVRVTGGAAELVAVHHTANEAGCLGEGDGDPQATETRVDDLRSWIAGGFPGFATGFEDGQPALHFADTIDDAGPGHGGLRDVVGICCSLTGPEAGLRAETPVHGGTTALMYSGKDNNATNSYAYTKIFKPGNPRVRASTVLSYSIFPQSTTSNRGVTGTNSTCVAVDLVYTDGTNLRDSGVADQRGNRAHPAHQCNKLPLDTWTRVVVPIGRVAEGKQIGTITVGYDQPANTGGYRGYVDDLAITDVVAPPVFSTGLETGQPAPGWTDTVSTGAPAGGLRNVSGICCSLTGPETGVRAEHPRSGDKVLMFSGKDDNATSSHAYTKAFPLSSVFVTPTTRLSYWIHPQSTTANRGVAGTNSTCVSIDLILRSHTDGTARSLRDSGATDSRGNSAHPRAQCTKLPLDRWTYVSVPLGGVANGREITQIDVAYDQPANTGGYRGYLDDIRIMP
jgi:hypothetical protein